MAEEVLCLSRVDKDWPRGFSKSLQCTTCWGYYLSTPPNFTRPIWQQDKGGMLPQAANRRKTPTSRAVRGLQKVC